MVVLGSKEELFPDIMTGMNSLRKDKSLYDVLIRVKGQEIAGHKSVLAPISDYFKSLFLGPFKTDSAIVEVDFSSVALDIESAEAVIEYLYTGTIEINDDNLEAILKLATFLLIKQLQDLCIKFMEQSCDLNSYMRYFVLAVDYMVPEAEEIVVKVVKSRFHDWFMFGETAKSLMFCHLQKLAMNYHIFEHCSKIDILSFLVEWVLKGKTEEHEALACKILDTKSKEGEKSDTEIQSEDESQQQSKNEPQSKEESQSKIELQSKEESQSENELQSKVESKSENEMRINNESPSKSEPQSKGELQRENKTQSEDEPQTDMDMESEEEDQSQTYQQLSYDVPQKIDMIRDKLERSNGCSQFKEKIEVIIVKHFYPDTHLVEASKNVKNDNSSQQVVTKAEIPGLQIQESVVIVDPDDFTYGAEMGNQYCPATHVIQQVEVGTSEAKPENVNGQIQESEGEQVLFAVAPKKRLNDAECSESVRWNENIFDICVYVPKQMTWYYFGEGKNDGAFKLIAVTKASWSSNGWSHNFCTKDYLCCASPVEKRLYMYPLKHSNNPWGPCWSHVSYKDIVKFFRDLNIRSDVCFCCSDGETIYMVLKKRNLTPESKVKFKCYRLSGERSWDFVFETPYLLKSEDYQVCDSIFNVHVSSENKEMLIAVESRFHLHTFAIDLENIHAEMIYNFLEPGASMLEGLTIAPQTDFWIMVNGKRVSFVNEIFLVSKGLHYSFMEVNNSEGMSIGYTGHHWIEHIKPSDHKENTCSKLVHSVCDGRSAWVFLSDGKFETSMVEMIVNRYGVLEFKQQNPPPFSAITLMARGLVRREHLAHLKPMKEFLQE